MQQRHRTRCKRIAVAPVESPWTTHPAGRNAIRIVADFLPSLVLLLATLVLLPPWLPSVVTVASGTASAGGSGTSSGSGGGSSIHMLGASILLDTLQRHNSSGLLPPIPQLNALLREANGEKALQIDDSFATASADSTARGLSELLQGLNLEGAGLNMDAAAAGGMGTRGFSSFAGFTPPTMTGAFPPPQSFGFTNSSPPPQPPPPPPFSGGPPPFPAPGGPPSDLFGAGGRSFDAASAPASAAAPNGGAGASNASNGSDPPNGNGNGDGAASPLLPTKVDRAIAQTICILRFGMTDIAYGFLNVAAFQVAAVAQFVDVGPSNEESLRYLLTGISNELRSIGYVFVGIQGIIRVQCALEDLGVALLARSQGEEGGAVFAHASPRHSGTGLANPTPAGYEGFFPLAAGEYDAKTDTFTGQAAAGGPANAEHTRAGQGESRPGRASPLSPSPSCPTFLYGRWMRIENGAASTEPPNSSDSSSAQSKPAGRGRGRGGPSSSVVLEFSADSYERVESHTSSAGRRRVQHQRWAGPLQVECEWDAEEEEEAEEQLETNEEELASEMDEQGDAEGASGPTRSSSVPSPSPLSPSASRFPAPSDTAATLRLADQLAASLAMPTRAAADITVRITLTHGATGSSEPIVLHFTYFPLLFEGNTASAAVLVERSADEHDELDRSFPAPGATSHAALPRRAFIKL